MIFIYRFFTNILLILLPVIILFRFLKKKENLNSLKEKICIFKKKRSKDKVIWFHGASVGEFQSVVPILEKLDKIKEINQILVTSNTLSSSKIVLKNNFKKIIHQFFPIDHNFFVEKFIDHWKPSAAIFIDFEIWPNMILKLNKKKIPIILINARITKKSFNRWILFKNFSKLIFEKLNICLSSNKKTVKYLKRLGAKNIKYFGNLKYSQSENEKIVVDNEFKKFASKKNVWCASSTHETEEEFIGLVHKKLKKYYRNLLTIIIPRHIDRKDKIKNQLNKLNLKVHIHEPKTKINKETDIYLVNSFGKTKSFYSIVKNVFLGGSLINHGGQNPLEAIRYGCNIIHGPNVSNFEEIYKFLHEKKISLKINSLNQAVNTLKHLFRIKQKNKNIRNKVNMIGKEILKNNLKELRLIINKI